MALRKCEDDDNVVNENSSLQVKYQLLGIDGVTPVTLGGADSMTMALNDKETQGTINSHTATDVKSEVDGSGIWTHKFAGDDNPIVTAANKSEIHVCTVTIVKAGADGFDLVDDFEIKVINKPFAT